MKESYALQPAEVEVFCHGGGTDVIMRKNISKVERQNEDMNGIEGAVSIVWECDEWQFREPGILTVDQVRNNWEHYWGYSPAAHSASENEYVTYGDLRKAITEGVNSL